MQQFLADLRADELDPAQLDAGVGRLSADMTVSLCVADVWPSCRAADHHVARGAEVLHLEVAVAELGDDAAHAFQLRGWLTSMTVPPVNSIDRWKPRVAMKKPPGR